MSCSAHPLPPGSEACGCCAGVEASTPLQVDNRAGLSTINYRIGAYPQFKASLLAGLSSSRYPQLAGLRTRGSDDYSIALLDAVACTADVLTFYQERIAQESYLRTATERVSLQEMGKLIGYRLRPGAAAETWLAFALESPKTAPSTLAPEPGAFFTGIPTALTLAAGLKVQSVPGPDEKPQVFETVEAVAARPEWNAMLALPDDDIVPGFGATSTWLAGVDTQLKPGDSLLFVGAEFAADPNSDRWDLRVLNVVQADAAANRTFVSWTEPLGSVSPPMGTAAAPTIYALRQRAAVFGHNAPDWPSMTDEFKAAYLGLESPDQLMQAQRAEWPQFDIHGPGGSGNGLLISASVAPLKAAAALREGLRADAQALAKQGLASLGSLGASAGSLLEKAASLPGEAGKASVEAMALLPGAIGQVTERVMEPIRWLVENGVGSMQSWVTQLGSSAASTASVVSSITSFLTGIPNLGATFGAPGGNLAPPTWPPVPSSLLTPLFNGLELQTLRNTLTDAADKLGEGLDDLAERGRTLRAANASVIEAAMANVAGAAYTARMEAELQVSPHLPFATADSVCCSAIGASGAARAAIPDLVVALALSDPRPGTVMLASLAPLGSDDDATLDMASLHSGIAGHLSNATIQLSATLNDPQFADAVIAGQAVMGQLNQLAAGGASAFTRSLSRMRMAAASGVQKAHLALVERADRLRLTPGARQFLAHAANTVSLDRPYPGLLAGSYAALQMPTYTELYRVSAVSEVSRAEFGIAGKSMLLSLQGENLSLFSGKVRETAVLAQSIALPRARSPLSQPVVGDSFDVAGAIAGLEEGRRLIVQGRAVNGGQNVVHYATLVSATVGSDRTTLRIDPPLPVALRRIGTVVYGNVALATHGETGAQILGAGDASQPFQRFELKRLPLTYRSSAADESGVDSELTVRIGDVAWTERRTLFGAEPGDRAYTVSTDEQGRDWVVFGDGVRGARLPTGVNNIRASYRQGLGLAGNVAPERLTQLMTRPMGLKSVANPGAAEGGSDPEPAEQARRSMPLGTRTLGRAVSLLDYEDYALAFSGVAKAQARALAAAHGPVVAITVAGQDGASVTASNPVHGRLLESLHANGDPHVELVLLSYRASTFRLGLKVRRDSAYEIATVLAAVEAALRAHYAFDARALGQPVLHSDVVAVAHSVPGVVAVDIDFLYGGTWPGQTAPGNRRRLLAASMHVAGGSVQPAELLTLHPGPLARLEEM